MSIANWLKKGQQLKRPRTEGLPDPRECSTEEKAQDFQACNDCIDLLSQQPKPKRRRAEYKRYDENTRSDIAKSALSIGVMKTARKFSMNESSVRYMKQQYLRQVKLGKEPTTLPTAPRGRPCMLGDFDNRVQLFIRAARENGAAISARVVMSAAEGLLNKFARYQLASNGGHISVTKSWARSLLRRMGYTQRKGTKGIKHLPKDFDTIKSNYLADINKHISDNQIPDELVINWDQTGCQLLPGGNWTMEQRGKEQVPIQGMDDKRQITLLLSVTKSGSLLPPQLLYAGKTPKCLPSTTFPSDWDAYYSPNHWSNEETMLHFLDHIIIPYVEQQREQLQQPDQAAPVIFDVYAAHRTEAVIQKLLDNNIRYTKVPAACTDQLQPLDLSLNKEYKNSLKHHFNQWYADQVASQIDDLEDEEQLRKVKVDTRMSVIKPLHAQWIISVHSEMSTKRKLILDGFVKAGILQLDFSDL